MYCVMMFHPAAGLYRGVILYTPFKYISCHATVHSKTNITVHDK